ncbi:hypothetical protein ACL02S_03215 [Nocardia sp. 004]|uniref:hypothetical protein n=1 Tax=Nocardia sp. 004 TaxID=3385978 RepID=UPI00399FA684
MRRLRVPLITVAATLALSGGLVACGSENNTGDTSETGTATATSATSAAASSTSASATATTSSSTDQAADEPTGETLRAILTELTDPAVSTEAKTALIVDGEQRTANIDQMNAGLQGYPLSFTVTDITTQGSTANARVTIESPHGAAPAVPMSWENVDGTWKLSDASGCLLLGFAKAPCAPA